MHPMALKRTNDDDDDIFLLTQQRRKCLFWNNFKLITFVPEQTMINEYMN